LLSHGKIVSMRNSVPVDKFLRLLAEYEFVRCGVTDPMLLASSSGVTIT
jgi:hypothetical protein